MSLKLNVHRRLLNVSSQQHHVDPCPSPPHLTHCVFLLRTQKEIHSVCHSIRLTSIAWNTEHAEVKLMQPIFQWLRTTKPIRKVSKLYPNPTWMGWTIFPAVSSETSPMRQQHSHSSTDVFLDHDGASAATLRVVIFDNQVGQLTSAYHCYVFFCDEGIKPLSRTCSKSNTQEEKVSGVLNDCCLAWHRQAPRRRYNTGIAASWKNKTTVTPVLSCDVTSRRERHT